MIVHCGEALIDFIPGGTCDGDAAFVPVPGGSPYNSAIASARLGVPAAFLGTVSTDFFGDQLFDTLEANGVDGSYVNRADLPTTLAFVKKNERGEARYAFFANGAADRSLLPAEVPELSDTVRAIHVGSISLLGEPAGDTIERLAVAEGKRRVVSFDPNVRPGLIANEGSYRERFMSIAAATTIIKISDEDLQWFDPHRDLEVAARGLLTDTTRLVVVTRGSDGVTAYGPFGSVMVDAVNTNVADTIGAGDSFHAALLSWLHLRDLLSFTGVNRLSAANAEKMLRFAATVAAVTCSRAGADPPRMDELPDNVRL